MVDSSALLVERWRRWVSRVSAGTQDDPFPLDYYCDCTRGSASSSLSLLPRREPRAAAGRPLAASALTQMATVLQ